MTEAALEQLLLTYGPLGIMVLVAGYIIRELHKANQAKDNKIAELQDKRLEDAKILLTTIQEHASATKILSETLNDQNELIKGLILRAENAEHRDPSTKGRGRS